MPTAKGARFYLGRATGGPAVLQRSLDGSLKAAQRGVKNLTPGIAIDADNGT